MNIALIQIQLTYQEITQLSKEFPELLFLSFPGQVSKPINPEYWQKTEVVLGERLSCEELVKAPNLRWVHVPSPNLTRICLKDIEKQGNILISDTREENLFQIGEFVFSGILAFAKNLFQWKEVSHFPSIVWDSKCRNNMWTLKDRIFLQLGLGAIGIELARRAQLLGMKVWGVGEVRSFHPCCHKTFDYEDLPSILPLADVVSLALPREKGVKRILGQEELSLMKDDSILAVLGSTKQFDEASLLKLTKQNKFRGILIDAYYEMPIPHHSALWSIPQALITPEAAPRPKTHARDAFRIFRFNLRQYLHGNFSDMKNLIDPSIAFVPLS